MGEAMRRVLVTFGGSAYDPITVQVLHDAQAFGVTEVLVYDDVWLTKHEFWELNRWLYEHRSPLAAPGRGLGWYAWKPLIILDALDRMGPGDVVLYIDGDTWPIADLTPLYEIAARDGAMFFRASAHENYRWCTRDALIVMGLDPALRAAKRCKPGPNYLMGPAGCARFMALQKGPWKPRQLLMEWLTYCLNCMATTFEPSILGEDHPDFEEHRTEQAILTLLARKYDYTLYREADQAGAEFIGQPGQPGEYPQLFVQKHMGGPFAPEGSRYRNV